MDPIPTVHRYQTFLIEDTHKYPDQDISVIYETQDAIFLNDLKGRLTSLCIAHNGESQKDNPYYYKEFTAPSNAPATLFMPCNTGNLVTRFSIHVILLTIIVDISREIRKEIPFTAILARY